MSKPFKIFHRNHKYLTQKIQQEVTLPFNDRIYDQIDQMIDYLRYNKDVYEKKALALSANQAGFLSRFFIVADWRFQYKKFNVIINPKILDQSSDTIDLEEGCVSIPKYACIVNRPKFIQCEYYTLHGRQVKMDLDLNQTRIFLHEFDHLEGIHMMDRAKETYINPLYLEFLEKNKLKDEDLIDPIYQ